MKIKRILLTTLAMVLVAALSIAGTVAYLTSKDSDINVMTMPGIEIAQHEYERVQNADGTYEMVTSAKYGEGYKLQPFTQDKPLYPVVGTVTGWGQAVYFDQLSNGASGGQKVLDGIENVQDKFVLVENTGKSDAYVRTIIAFEMGDMSEAEWDAYTMTNVNDTHWTWNWIGETEIDGNSYEMVEVIYKGLEGGRHSGGILPAGEFTYNSLAQFYITSNADNAQLEALDGNDNGKYDILVFSQATQTAGFANAETALDAAFGDITTTQHPWVDGVKLPVVVYTAAELQKALDSAANGDTIILGGDIAGDVTVTQKANVNITIDGNGNEFAGVITVDGKSATYTTAGLTIKNTNFVADSISADACIRLGNGTNATRYTCNVTVSGCTFDVPGAVGVKSYTGGDKNLTIVDCTATSRAHSLVQAKGVDGVLVESCNVYSKNGVNFNNSTDVTVSACEIDVTGYAVRFGESSGGAGAAETYLIKNCTLKSACDDGDAVIILRGTADYATLTLENNTIEGTLKIANTATGATVIGG